MLGHCTQVCYYDLHVVERCMATAHFHFVTIAACWLIGKGGGNRAQSSQAPSYLAVCHKSAEPFWQLELAQGKLVGVINGALEDLIFFSGVLTSAWYQNL